MTEKQQKVLQIIKDHPLECPQWMALLVDMTPQAFGRVASALVKTGFVLWEYYPANRSHDGKQRITYRLARKESM